MNTLRKKANLALIILCIATILPRFLWLNTIPTGISNDEMDFIFNAKALYFTGVGLTGARSPFVIAPHFPNAELISVLIAPIVGPIPFTLFNARLLFALVGCASVFLLYFLTKKLFGQGIAWCVGLVAALSPWNIFFSRTLYDAPVTTFFWLLGWYLLLSQKAWKKLWALIPLGMGLFMYMGMALIFPLFVLAIGIFCWYEDKKRDMRPYIVIGVVLLLLFIQYVSIVRNLGRGARTGELFTPNTPSVAAAVNDERRTSGKSPFTSLFINKVTEYTKEATRKYVSAFSPNELLLYGDVKRIFTVQNHGLFYLTDVLLFVLGAWFLWTKNRRVFWVLFAILAISPIPSVASTESLSYSSRAYLMQPVLLVVIGCGLYVFIEYTRHRWTKRWPLLLAAAGIWCIEIASFGFIYFLQNPINNSESYNFSTRVLVDYANREAQKGRSLLVLSGDPKTAWKQYILFNNLFTKTSAHTIAALYAQGDNIHMVNIYSAICPPKGLDLTNVTVAIEGTNPCKTYVASEHPMVISQLGDAGSVYKIYNGLTCSEVSLKRFPTNIRFSDFAVDTLSDTALCETFIIRY